MSTKSSETNVSVQYVDVTGGYLFKQALLALKAKDTVSALKLLEAASQADCSLATVQLAMCHIQGIGVAKSFPTAMKILQPLVSKGVAEAEIALAFCYYSKENPEHNYTKAFELYLSASQKKLPDAYYSVALCYETGKGTTQNINKALEYFRLAAETGKSPKSKEKLKRYAQRMQGTTTTSKIAPTIFNFLKEESVIPLHSEEMKQKQESTEQEISSATVIVATDSNPTAPPLLFTLLDSKHETERLKEIVEKMISELSAYIKTLDEEIASTKSTSYFNPLGYLKAYVLETDKPQKRLNAKTCSEALQALIHKGDLKLQEIANIVNLYAQHKENTGRTKVMSDGFLSLIKNAVPSILVPPLKF
jgi:TPR repeat protein